MSQGKASHIVTGAFAFGLGLLSTASDGALANSGTLLSMFNFHTKESIRVNPDTRAGQQAVNHLLRDRRTGAVRPISPELIDLLQDMKVNLERRHPRMDVVFHVLSGYRSPQTNNNLRSGGGEQASNSRHTHSDAIDIFVPGVSTRELRELAWCLRRGGVGSYTTDGDNFVHVDTYKGGVRDRRFPNGSRYRAWGWSPSPRLCD